MFLFLTILVSIFFGFLAGIYVFKNNKTKADALADLAKAEALKVADRLKK